MLQIRSESYSFGRMPLEIWMPTYQIGHKYSKWDIQGNYHYHEWIRYAEVVEKQTNHILQLAHDTRVLKYRYLLKRTPQEIASRQFYLDKGPEDLLMDYRGVEDVPVVHYQYNGSGRSLYYPNVYKYPLRVRTRMPCQYDCYKVGHRA